MLQHEIAAAYNCLILLAIPAGFEPATIGLEVVYHRVIAGNSTEHHRRYKHLEI